MERMIWMVKQLLPLKYDTIYNDKEGEKVVIWRMFLGRCFNIKEYLIKDREKG